MDFYPYMEVGIGYKLEESNLYFEQSEVVSYSAKDAALIEAGFESKRLRIGIKHDSQYSTGWPFDKRNEYYKTELFIKIKIGGIRS